MASNRSFPGLIRSCLAVRIRVYVTAVALGMVLVFGLVSLLSWLPFGSWGTRGSPVPLIFAIALWAGVGTLAWGVRRETRRLTPRSVAEEVDIGAGLGRGDVRAALELGERGPPTGLVAVHIGKVSETLGGLAPREMLPVTWPLWGRRILQAGVSLIVVSGLLLGTSVVRREPLVSAATVIMVPWKTTFPAPLPALVVQVPQGVPRGEVAEVAIEATGRTSVELFWVRAGLPREASNLVVGETGRVSGEVGPIEGPTMVWVEDGSGASSDTALTRPLEPLLVQDLRVQVEYPSWMARESDSYRHEIPALRIPAGSQLRITGQANLDLSEGRLRFDGSSGDLPSTNQSSEIDLSIDGARFSVMWRPERTGSWSWDLESPLSAGEPLLPQPLSITVVPDLAPGIELIFPAPDTLLGYTRVMPLVVDVADDTGLERAVVRSWRSGLGTDRAARVEILSPDPAGAPRAVFRHLLDRSSESFIPGDTVFYRIAAFDGHPIRGPGISPAFLLRVPTFTEMQDDRELRTEELSKAAEELEAVLDALAEEAAEAARATTGDTGDSEEARFEATEDARRVAEEAARTQEDVEDLDEDLETLSQEVAESPLVDPALSEQLERLAEQLEMLREQGLAQELEGLEEALSNLDPEQVRQALEELAERASDLQEQVDQALAMLDQAALEQAMKAAQSHAEDLAADQRQMAEETDAELFEEGQSQLADQAEDLVERLEELQERLVSSGRDMAADSAGAAEESVQEALSRMQSAAEGGEESGATGERQVSEQQQADAEAAAEALQNAAGALGGGEDQMNQAQGEAAVESLARARSEAMSLAEEEGRLAEQARAEEPIDPEEWRASQAAVRQGLENMLNQLSSAGNEAAMLDQRSGAAAGNALQEMDNLLQRLAGDGTPRLPSRAEAQAIQTSLNDVAAALLAREQAAQAAQESQAGEAAQQMNQLAQQQQALTQETSALMVPGPRQTPGSERREEIARRQQEIAEELSELEDPEEELLGRTEEMAEEATEIARDLDQQGPTEETLNRQRRLFQRMLDAGRSIEDEDLDPNERESQTANTPPVLPEDIDPELLRGRRFPVPSEEVLRQLPLVYRAIVFEYFDRLTAGASGGASGVPQRVP